MRRWIRSVSGKRAGTWTVGVVAITVLASILCIAAITGATTASQPCPCGNSSAGIRSVPARPDGASLELLVPYLEKCAEGGIIDAVTQRTVSETLARQGERRLLTELFAELERLVPENYFVALDYAAGLAGLKDPDAETWYQKALARLPDGSIAAIAEYAQWLLEGDRPLEALKVLALQEPGQRFHGLHFYRAVALEEIGQAAAAQGQYEKYLDFNRAFAAPAALRTPGGESAGVRYDDDPGVLDTCSDARLKLSQMVYCEARGESSGGQAAAAWTARNRVFVYNPNPGCNKQPSSGTYCEKYLAVLVPGEFCIGTSHNSDTDATAYCVFYGLIPDPVAQRCPYGPLLEGTWCDGACKYGSETGGFSTGGYFFYSTTGTCSSTHPSGCGVNRGKVCGDGGYDHCFYSVQ